MSEREPLSDEERELQAKLDLEAEPPRRNDAAFARAVAEGIEARRRPALVVPTLVTASLAAALLFAVDLTPEPEAAPPADLLAATLSALDEPADDEVPLIDDELASAVYDEGWDAFADDDVASSGDTDDAVDADDVDEVSYDADDELALMASVELPDEDEELRALSALLDDAIAARRSAGRTE